MKSGRLNLLEPLGYLLGLLYIHNIDYPKSHIILHELTAVNTLPLNDQHINGFWILKLQKDAVLDRFAMGSSPHGSSCTQASWPFLPHNLISAQESPVHLPQFQLAPRVKILMPSGSNKWTQIYYPFHSKIPGKRIPSRFSNGASMERDTRLQGIFTSLLTLWRLNFFPNFSTSCI
jgi:hypothetical protein